MFNFAYVFSNVSTNVCVNKNERNDRLIKTIVPRKLLPERNVVVYYTEFDEFKEELERSH